MDIELVEMRCTEFIEVYKLLIINNRLDRLNVQKTLFRQPLLNLVIKDFKSNTLYLKYS